MSSKNAPRRRKDLNFETHIYRVLKQVNPDTGITKSALKSLDLLIVGFGEKLAQRAVELMHLNGVVTVTSRDIQSAVRSLLVGELGKQGVSEGTKAVTKFNAANAGRQGSKSPRKTSAGAMAGLTLPPSRGRRLLRIYTNGGRVSKTSAFYLSAVLEYLAAEILELAGNASRDSKKNRITKRHMLLAIRHDYELNATFKCALLAGGVVPNIPTYALKSTPSEPTKPKKAKKASSKPVSPKSAPAPKSASPQKVQSPVRAPVSSAKSQSPPKTPARSNPSPPKAQSPARASQSPPKPLTPSRSSSSSKSLSPSKQPSPILKSAPGAALEPMSSKRGSRTIKSTQ